MALQTSAASNDATASEHEAATDGATPPVAPMVEPGGEATNEEIPEVSEVRVIEVPRTKPSVDGPKTAKRKSNLGEPGPSLTMHGIARLHGPRSLVRWRFSAHMNGGIVNNRRLDEKRRVVAAFVRVARPALRRCHADAFERTRIADTNATVEITFASNGTVRRARIVAGGLVDALGDVCMIEGLKHARLAKLALARTVRIRVPLEFIYEKAATMSEGWAEPPNSKPLP